MQLLDPRREPTPRERALEEENRRLRDMLRVAASGTPYEEAVERILERPAGFQLKALSGR
jgi:hypothetical protein